MKRGESRPGESHNLFFGLFPDAGVRGRIEDAAFRLHGFAGKGRWIKPQRYHLTLLFLGAMAMLPADVVGRACAAAARVRVPAFDLVLDRVGCFRKRGIPWWLGCSEMPVGLKTLWDSLAAELRREGIVPRDRQLTPHVTVLRDADAEIEPAPMEPVRWPVDGFRLVESRLAPSPEYVVRGDWPLGPRA